MQLENILILGGQLFLNNTRQHSDSSLIGHFNVIYLIAKPLIWSEAEGDLVVRDQYLVSMITKFVS